MIKLRTVQHTGTTFMKQLFREFGVSYNHKHFGRDDMPDIHGDITVCTIRDPKTCFLSTKSRGRYDQCFHKGYQELNEIYSISLNKANNHPIIFIPIDKPEKQQALDQLNAILGIKMITDWTPVSTRRHKTNIQLIDLSTEYKLPVIEKFYGQTETKTTKKANPKANKKSRKKKRASKQTQPTISTQQSNSDKPSDKASLTESIDLTND